MESSEQNKTKIIISVRHWIMQEKRYVLEEKLGSGTFGTVYEVTIF